jgi:UDP-N-acetylmuramoyl-tripeptide--D-alanyl-D-alanine ligase
MNYVWYVIGGLWTARILLNVLSYVQLWYVKEYRFDRMLIHLKTPQGKKLLFIRFRRPPITPKTIVITLFSIVALGVTYMAFPGIWIMKFFFIDIFSFVVVSIVALLLRVPTLVYHWVQIKRAVAKLRAHVPMTVIGITGSFGKTSTKEIAFTLLSSKYKTLATKASKNSPIAIAELILAELRPEHEVFVVEMGAYKKGEIKEMCDMVLPTIAIVTAINAQHQDLFGSIEKTVEAKYELVDGLVQGGVAIMNADNEFVLRMSKRAEDEGKKVILYATKKTTVPFAAIGIKQEEKQLKFTLIRDGKKTPLSVGLFGTHQVSNMLAAIAASEFSGMTNDEIAKAMKDVKPFSKTMTPMPGINGSEFIDDTFNNNPDAAIAALRYLDSKSGKKYVVFQPMIELGSYAKESHERVAKEMAKVATELFLTNDSFQDIFQANSGNSSVHILTPQKTAQRLKDIVAEGDTVLFKGKEASRVLQLLV